MNTPKNNINNDEENNIEDLKESNIKENNIEESKELNNIEESKELNEKEIKVNKKPKASIKEILSNKRIRYGTYASVMTLAIIAVVIVINLVVDQLGLKFDLTVDKMYSLSDQTKQIVSALDKDVNIYPIYSSGNENIAYMEMLDKYKPLSSKITITTKDPNINPQFMQKYIEDAKTIGEGSIIVEAGERFKILSSYDLLDYQQNSYGQTQATGIALEQKVTGAIQYVTTDDLPVAYTLEGHNEIELNAEAKQSLINENYEVKTLSIVTEGAIPEDTSLLIVNPPVRDYSEVETEILSDYLSKGGRAIFTLHSADVYIDELPNYESVLSTYGVKPQSFPVVEGSMANIFQNYPLFLIPNIETHDITTPLTDNKLRIILPMTQAIEILDEKSANTKITPLLTTSNSAYAKTNPESTSIEKEKEDIEGPFDLAVLIEDNWFNDSKSYQSKIIVLSSVNLLDANANASSSGANLDLFMNSVNYLVDKKESLYIRSKSLAIEPLTLNALQALTISGIAVIVIPLTILIVGIVIWFRRKNK